MSPLPVDAVLGDLLQALQAGGRAVLQAPPGAGKTTRVPLALLNAPWLSDQRILMLEPRRLAARAAARYMAASLGEPVGRTVGYRVRMDSRVGPATRIEVLTEGVLTRMLQRDPSLAGVGMVIFDEYHERHLDSDLGLALCLEIQGVLNTELRLLVMSATLDSAPVAALLGQAPVIACTGRLFPVETRHIARRPGSSLESDVAAALLAAAEAETGSILVFLPGAAEIRHVERLVRQSLPDPGWIIAPLFGNLPRAAQDRAITAPDVGRRKVVLATAIAETSLTIEGVRVVVDSGFMRVPRFDVRSGMTRLQTLPVSLASADQRRGRAGRNAPGVCYRLWSRETHRLLNEFNRPEILEADLSGLALELALWGVTDPDRLSWLDPPPAVSFLQARRLLEDLGALDAEGRVTGHGRQVAGMPLHPRLAHMVLAGDSQGLGELACELAAILTERDFVRFRPGERDADLRLRVQLLKDRSPGTPPAGSGVSIDAEARRRVAQVAAVLKKRFGFDSPTEQTEAIGRLLAWAYPDRIARRRSASSGRFVMVNGRGAYFSKAEPLAAEDFLVPVELDGEPREARIFRAAAYDLATLQEQFADRIQWEQTIEWDTRTLSVAACNTLRFGALALKSAPLPAPDLTKVSAALARGIREQGCDCLPWTPGLRRWQARVGFVGRMLPEDEKWPDLSDPRLLATLEGWLVPKITGITRLRDLQRIDLKEALEALLTWNQRRRLETLAPPHLVVPSGSRIQIDYAGAVPVLAVRIQEMFGADRTPTVADGRQPVLLHLLSPAGRPMQITQDLAGFWQDSYHQVKKDLKGRYPKHHWPDDPFQAQATHRTRPRGR